MAEDKKLTLGELKLSPGVAEKIDRDFEALFVQKIAPRRVPRYRWLFWLFNLISKEV